MNTHHQNYPNWLSILEVSVWYDLTSHGLENEKGKRKKK